MANLSADISNPSEKEETSSLLDHSHSIQELNFSPLILTSIPEIDPNHERRGAVRRESRCLVAIVPLKPGEQVPKWNWDWKFQATRLHGVVEDLSRTGASFSINRPIDLTRDLLLRIGHRRKSESIVISGRVVGSVLEGAGWHYRVKFFAEIPLQDVMNYSDSWDSSGIA